ncbi:tetratricopeptide repeat protein [Porphyromonas asaccharolytica]|uniref:Tetratricopeptide TPR_2 repeat-containing protein n=1 Tax=Porphyromonas asaccharolytica (strain ATCC 25260 / DSM 20707 / BCRC 10618 / CCUG 7834 / JCM 6326 / LMG 13178 / VPI 4198 / B440) TaxID=879243 RepID=F4KKE2_PORAD|nr:tetratricopeptide repeat protein [Porphyromonas asaccharolytica]AEE12867.1 Tetratricopeptide TPR_2 repeat-containing protein [Porphyromonas asaccharolytica DSM 20707]EFR35385.1 tetratricopeptide repeat protein [Porphyromonas asaccharolytica PR426713P-I]
MTYRNLLKITTALLLAVLVSSCACRLKPLNGSAAQVDPNPLTLVGTQIPGQVRLTLPAKWCHKRAIVNITPQLRYAGTSVTGQTVTIQGENVRDNYQTISYERGGSVIVPFAFEYKPGMEQSDLYLTFTATIKGKKVNLPAIKVARGTIMTAGLASISDVTPALARDAFQRVIKEQYTADLKFLINRAEVRAAELNKREVKDWQDVVDNAYQVPNQEVDIEIQAYASPDGAQDFNERLSAQRERNTSSVVARQLGKKKIEVNAHYTAEDWDGFQKLLEASNIQDKELVLRVLSMYPDPEDREREIRNLSHVFTQLADEILPELRRSRLNANVRIIGKSDDELKMFMAQRPGRLTIEEILYTATLYDNAKDQMNAYQQATQLYPKDYRAYNNIGTLYLAQGNYEQAANYFAKAQKIQPNAASNMNEALLALNRGDLAEAQRLMGSAVEVPEAGQGIGLLQMHEGKYADAIRSFGNTPSNTLAIAQIMQGQYADATRTLAAVAQPNGETAYLKAVVAARTNDLQALISNLRSAIAQDRSYALRAQRDLEFAAFSQTPEFVALVK